MTRNLVSVVVLIAAACGTGRLPAWVTGELTPEQRARVKPVVAVGQYVSTGDWESSPWFRIDDMLTPPVFIAVASDRTACVIPAADWAILQPSNQYPCPGAWRVPRPVVH